MDSPRVRIALVDCNGHDGGPEERMPEDCLIIPLEGRFLYRSPRERIYASPITAVAVHGTTDYRVTHPDGCGDLCLSATGPMISELVAERSGNIGWGDPGNVFVDLLFFEQCLQVDVVETALTDLCSGIAQSRKPRDLFLAKKIDELLTMGINDLRSLSKELGMSRFHLCRSYKAVHGYGIGEKARELRLRRSLALLRRSGRTLADISLEAGYANQGHFNNAFRRRFGLSPGRYRESFGLKSAISGPA